MVDIFASRGTPPSTACFVCTAPAAGRLAGNTVASTQVLAADSISVQLNYKYRQTCLPMFTRCQMPWRVLRRATPDKDVGLRNLGANLSYLLQESHAQMVNFQGPRRY